MMNDPQNLQDLHRLEAQIQSMPWGTITLEPAIEDVQVLDQQLPIEWVAPLNQEQELQNQFDFPPGDIDANTRQAINELELDIDTIFKDMESRENELDAPTIEHRDKGIDRDDDFGR